MQLPLLRSFCTVQIFVTACTTCWCAAIPLPATPSVLPASTISYSPTAYLPPFHTFTFTLPPRSCFVSCSTAFYSAYSLILELFLPATGHLFCFIVPTVSPLPFPVLPFDVFVTIPFYRSPRSFLPPPFRSTWVTPFIFYWVDFYHDLPFTTTCSVSTVELYLFYGIHHFCITVVVVHYYWNSWVFLRWSLPAPIPVHIFWVVRTVLHLIPPLQPAVYRYLPPFRILHSCLCSILFSFLHRLILLTITTTPVIISYLPLPHRPFLPLHVLRPGAIPFCSLFHIPTTPFTTTT